MEIRRYQPQDNEAIKTLHFAGLAQIGADTDPYHDRDLDEIEDIYLNSRGDFLVGIVNGQIVAMGAIRDFSGSCGEVKRIRVRRDCQRKGYGETILQKLIEIAAERGYTELRLDTLVDNVPSQRLFTKCGFSETHRGKVGGYDLVFYARKLNKGG